MSQNKNHHFVPQFYLRRFGHGKSIAVFNLDRGVHIACASIAGQCQRSHLYGKDPSVEMTLSALEGSAAAVITNIVTQLTLPAVPSEGDAALLNFIAYQRGRTPAAAAVSNVMATKMAQAVLKASVKLPEGLRDHVDAVSVQHNDPVLYSLALVGSLAPMLFDLQRCVLVNKSEIEFVTSDAPVVFHNGWCERVTWQGTTGFASAGLQVLLPLSPRHVLLMFDRDVYAVGCRKAPVAVRVGSNRDVEAVNALQVSTAMRNLYYTGDSTTARSIDRLPLGWRQRAEDAVQVHRALEVGGHSQLVHMYERSHARFPVSFLRILKKARRVPMKERARMVRPQAMVVDEVLHGPRGERFADLTEDAGKAWESVDD